MTPALRRIADYLASRRRRELIDPAEVEPSLLPHLFVLSIEPDRRLLVRLTGTALDRAFGRSVKGHYMEEFLHGHHSADVLQSFHDCAASHGACWMRQVVRIKERPPRFVEGVVFYIEPALLYGGLMVGEVADLHAPTTFEGREI
nr:PAS domain-containing protein [uncultured Dongia sp.]